MPIPSMAAAAIKTPSQVRSAATPNEPPAVGKKRQGGERELPKDGPRGHGGSQGSGSTEQQAHGRCGLTTP